MDEIAFDRRWLGAYTANTDWPFHRTLFARYGIVLAPGEYSAILRTLRSGQARLVMARGKQTAVYSVRVRSAGRRIYVLAVGYFPKSAWPPERVERLVKRAKV
jgi:hypothetical protein